jgi:hypothetical protein
MAAYAVDNYSTGVQDTVQDAIDALETKLETLDSSTNTIYGIGVELTGRDRDQAVGWLIFAG